MKSKEQTQNSFSHYYYSIPILGIHIQHGCNKSFNTERIKSVGFLFEETWNRDKTAKLQFE